MVESIEVDWVGGWIQDELGLSGVDVNQSRVGSEMLKFDKSLMRCSRFRLGKNAPDKAIFIAWSAVVIL